MVMDDLRFYVLFNSISFISGQCADDNERPCAVEPYLQLRTFPVMWGSNTVQLYVSVGLYFNPLSYWGSSSQWEVMFDVGFVTVYCRIKRCYRVFPDAQISAFCRILNANVPHFAWQCAQMGATFHFLRRFGSMSNSGNRRLNLHLVMDRNHPCDIDRFIWFPTQKSAGCDNSRERGTNIC